jgi:hypothetical protein
MKILKESNPDWLYMQLHMFKRGLLDGDKLTDDLIFNVRPNGIISLRFENDEQYFKLFDFHNDDIWFLTHLFSTYSGLELFDNYRAEEDWREGYVFPHYFNEENREKMEEIKRLIAPNLNLDDDGKNVEFCRLLEELFNNRIDYIIGDYESEMDGAYKSSMEKEITKELCEIFYDEGIHNSQGCFNRYVTTVDNLIKLYDKYGDKNSDLLTLLKTIGHTKSVNGDYYNEIYEYFTSDEFDYDSFNRSVSYQLDNIISDMEDDDKFADLEQYKNIVSYVTKKFKFNVWYGRPKDESKMMFKVIRVNPETNNIEIEYKKKGTMDFKKGNYDLEQFNNFLYHPELFD